MDVKNVVDMMKRVEKLKNSEGTKKSGDQKKELVLDFVKNAILKNKPDTHEMILEGIMMMTSTTIDGIVEIAKKNINLKQLVKSCGCF